MKIILVLSLFYSFVSAQQYYAKVAPYEIKKVSAVASGIVEFIDENKIGKVLDGDVYIKIDSQLDEKELKSVVKKIAYLQKTLEVSKKILKNLEASLQRKRKNYKRVESLKIKSSVEKDNEFYALINSENSSLNTQKEINNLSLQITDLQQRKVTLEKVLRDKKLSAKKPYMLYSIDVKLGIFVNKGTPLAQLADVSKGLITLYVDANELQGIEKKVVYIDGDKTPYRVRRYEKIADSVNISKYKVQIVINPPKIFSKLVKVELKDE